MRIYAWWSFYIQSKNELDFDNAILDIEQALGHKIQVRDKNFADWWPQPDNGDKVHQIDAWSYLEAETTEQACVHIFRQVQAFASPLSARTFQPADDAYELLALYWTVEDQPGLSQILSSGVEIGLHISNIWEKVGCDKEETIEEQKSCLEYLENIRTAPLITLPPANKKRNDYTAFYQMAHKASTKQKFMTRHWPEIQKGFSSQVILHTVEKRPHNKGPFHFTVAQHFQDITEDEAIMTALLTGRGSYIRLEDDKRQSLKKLHNTIPPTKIDKEQTGIIEFSLTPARLPKNSRS